MANEELNKPNIHPVLRVKPITQCVWNMYGPPPLAMYFVEQAFEDIRREEIARIHFRQQQMEIARKANFKSRRNS